MALLKKDSSSHPLVAVDMGRSSVRAMAAERTPDGLLRILGAESSNRHTCVERGIITNTSNASYSIVETLKLLANRIQCTELNTVFVPLGGQSMRVVQVCPRKDYLHKVEIQQHMLDEIDKECKQNILTRNPQVAVLGMIPESYILDGIEQIDTPSPQQRAAKIKVKYSVFVGKKELEQKVDESFERTSKIIEHKYARPDALLCALATENDLRDGCAILDMGAQTTTLTIFKGNRYLYNSVIPQGGADITRDITEMGIPEKYAEYLKCNYACALPELIEDNRTYRIPTEEKTISLTALDLANIVAGRLDQILAPLLNELNTRSEDVSVIYITGGASMLQGMVDYVQSMTQIPVMYGSHAAWLEGDTPDELFAPNYSSLIGTILLGGMYRDAHPTAEPEHALIKKISKIKTKVEEETLRIFSDTMDNY